jgi:hypothetical protein
VTRSERDILEEILALSRASSSHQREALPMAALRDLERAYDALVALAEGENSTEDIKSAVRSIRSPVRYILSRSGRRAQLSEREHIVPRREAAPLSREDQPAEDKPNGKTGTV